VKIYKLANKDTHTLRTSAAMIWSGTLRHGLGVEFGTTVGDNGINFESSSCLIESVTVSDCLHIMMLILASTGLDVKFDDHAYDRVSVRMVHGVVPHCMASPCSA
jgi:hypothetical protein